MVSSQWHYWHLGPHNSLFWRAVGCVASTHEMPVASPTHEDQTCLQTLWLWNSPGGKIDTGWEALICSKVAKLFFLPFCPGCHILNTSLLTAQYIVSLYVINILSSAALKFIFFLYLVFRSLTRLCPGVVFWGSQSVLDLWIPVLQQIWKSLAVVSSKHFSSPILSPLLLGLWLHYAELPDTVAQGTDVPSNFFPVSRSFILGNFYWHIFKFTVLL